MKKECGSCYHWSPQQPAEDEETQVRLRIPITGRCDIEVDSLDHPGWHACHIGLHVPDAIKIVNLPYFYEYAPEGIGEERR